MRRETNQWLMAFSVSFGVTFLAMAVVLGGICFVSYTRTGLGMAEVEKPQAARPDAYLPDREDRLVMLVAGTEEEGQPPDSYLLLGFLPDKGKIALCVLPAITYLEHGGQGTTLGRMWQQGGLGYVQKGLSQYLGIPIHRRATVTVEGLDALMAYGGLLDYQLGVDLDYPFHGRQVVMPRGRYQLDSRRVMDVIGYPADRGGERERSDRAALLLSQLISRDLPLFLGEEGERLQRTALTALDTDLSAADCLRRAPALEFLARLELPVTTAVYLEGSLSRNYTVYHLTAGCKGRIWEMYGEEGTRPAWDAGEAAPAEEPVPDQKKPVPPAESSRDSGRPPIQEQQPLESPFVKFR